MKVKHTLATLFLVSACALSSSVNAQESGLERIIASYVKGAVISVSEDIDIQLEKSMVSASSLITINNEDLPSGSVKITDLVAEKKTKEDKTTEKVNQNENADD